MKLLLCLLLLSSLPLYANNIAFKGKVALELQAFQHKGKQNGSEQFNSSLELKPEWSWEKDIRYGMETVVFTPFLRLDQEDKERRHFDLRELYWSLTADTWEVKLGIIQVYWGVTEFLHLVDIVNQTDAIESVDGEDKLGQPSLGYSWFADWGGLDLYVLPGFRERTFPGRLGRPHSILVDTDKDQYTSDRDKQHIDLAARLNASYGPFDLALSAFKGTTREPLLIPLTGTNSTFFPLYDQIEQWGFESQAIFGDMALKGEIIYRDRSIEHYWAGTGGFEYTLVGIFESSHDLGLLSEIMYDNQRKPTSPLFDKDLFAGFRWVFNDESSSEILFGFVQDLKRESNLFSFEATRRLNDNIKFNLEGRVFMEAEQGDALHSIKDEDFVKFEAAYFF